MQSEGTENIPTVSKAFHWYILLLLFYSEFYSLLAGPPTFRDPMIVNISYWLLINVCYVQTPNLLLLLDVIKRRYSTSV